MKSKKALPPKVAAWTEKPDLFLFNVCELIQSNLKRKYRNQDLLDFLMTDREELQGFMKTKLPPMNWLVKLAETKEGIKVLDYFNRQNTAKNFMPCSPLFEKN